MVEHLEAWLPEEACGLLSGRGERVTRVWPIENVEHSPVHYHMEHRSLVEAMLAIDGRGEELLAAFHSHPAGPDGVSGTDVREWQYPEAALIVWSRQGGRWSARAFVVSGTAARGIPLMVDEG